MGTEFNKEQFDAIYPEGIEHHYWTFARNKILNYILSKNNPKQTILEVGCGKGVVVNYLLNKGLNIKGVELAAIPIADSLKKNVKSGVDVFNIDMNEYNNIDTIMLLDVIEHIEFPNQFILNLKKKFPNLKRFIITVPACSELFSNYDEFNGHFRRYDRTTLKQEFNGLQIKKMEVSYFFHMLYFPARILLNTKGKRAEKIVPPTGFFKKLIHTSIANFFYIEFLVFPSKVKGTSLLLKVDLQ